MTDHVAGDAVSERCAVSADIAEEITQFEMNTFDVLFEVVPARQKQTAFGTHLLGIIVVNFHVSAKTFRGEKNFRAAFYCARYLRLDRRMHDCYVISKRPRSAERSVAMRANPL